jgi:hypothetical protein
VFRYLFGRISASPTQRDAPNSGQPLTSPAKSRLRVSVAAALAVAAAVWAWGKAPRQCCLADGARPARGRRWASADKATGPPTSEFLTPFLASDLCDSARWSQAETRELI